MDPAVLSIEDTGVVALTLVDRAASGYLDSWQGPDGVTAVTATLEDYLDAAAASWSCQITSGKLTPSKQSNRRDRAATFCAPASSTVQVGQSTWALDLAFFQDAHVRDGLTSYLFENDTQEAFFLLGVDGDAPPRGIGRVRLVAGGFGGEPRADLTDSVSLDVVRKPDIVFGRTGSSRLVTGAGVTTNTPA